MQNQSNTSEHDTVSAVILTRNNATTIRECLASVTQNQPYEIIIIDGYSHDATIEIVAEFTDRVYCDDGRGLCYARQLGAEEATGKYILYVTPI